MPDKKVLRYAKYLLPLALIICALAAARAEGASPLAEGKLFDRSAGAIERNYFDPARANPRKMFDSALGQIQRIIPEIMVNDKEPGLVTIVVGLAEKRFRTGSVASIGELKKVMHEILAFIAENYHGDTPPEEIEYAAIDGMLEVLDPHSNFMPPKVYTEFMVGTRGEFGGLGIVISIKDGNLTVIAPIEGTPASRVGIRPGDRILQIDDESTINMSLTDAVNRLRGEVGSKVTIVVEHQGKPSRKITLTRAIINIDSVQSKLLADGGKRIGYIKVKSFQSNTDDDVKAALKKFHNGGAKLDGLILDLRNNAGGLLNIAIDLADHFLKEGVIVSTVGPRDQVIEKESAHEAQTEDAYPIIVLINEGSASASEIVAGALQANDRAAVMGSRSFGKGSVQTIFELGDGCALKLTIAQYKPAGTQTIQLIGVTPDVNLQPATVDTKEMNLVEDILVSELDLEQHLDNGDQAGAHPLPKSAFNVRYLMPKEDEKAREEKTAREYAKEPEIEKDFAVELARRFIARAGSGSRSEMMKRIAEPLKESESEQDHLIDGALRPLGIDWSVAGAGGEPKLYLGYHLRSGKTYLTRARAGEKIELELTARNTGTGTYSQLIAVGQSDMPFLANKEFPFGRISPGETKSFSVPIELPMGLPKQNLSIDVAFEEANGVRPAPLSVIIPMDELPQPAFSFSYRLPPETRGRPFAKLPSIPMSVEITNIGQGTTSADTSATLSNECGDDIFIEKGRTKIGALKPGATARADFRFHVVSNSEPAPEKCQLKLMIADMKRFLVFTKKLDIMAKDGTIKPPPGQKYTQPTIEVSKYPGSTAEVKAMVSGTITDADDIRDYFVFVGDKKVAYVSNAEQKSTLPFSVTVPLEPGPNQITIGARDALDIMGRRIIVIDRTSGERKKDKRRQNMYTQP